MLTQLKEMASIDIPSLVNSLSRQTIVFAVENPDAVAEIKLLYEAASCAAGAVGDLIDETEGDNADGEDRGDDEVWDDMPDLEDVSETANEIKQCFGVFNEWRFGAINGRLFANMFNMLNATE